MSIGDDFSMTGGTICADVSVHIGNRVTIGANSIVVDTDFHPVDCRVRDDHPNSGLSAPTIVEDDVFIGANCLILKGVRIGRGAVIGAGSLVTTSIASFCIAAGNPAHVIKCIDGRGSLQR